MYTAQQKRAALRRNQARIIDLLRWSAEQYAAFIYECGLEYLQQYIGNDEEAISLLTPRTQFWNWWKNLFMIRDEAFIEEWDGMEDSIGREDLEKVYRDLHNPSVLACEIHPPHQVYGPNFTNIEMQPV